MYLVNTETLALEDFTAREKPPYAILSHRWTDNEVSFSDISDVNFRQRSNLSGKFLGVVNQTWQDGLKYVWVDTCCINKQSSAELSEAINSMFNWYKGAECCYVYLHDVGHDDRDDSFSKSQWFTRGWTLQELLAPRNMVFFDRSWRPIGTKASLVGDISRITGIEYFVIETGILDGYSVAQKMSWAAERVTTRPEDIAYCLMGLFNVNMPLLYGEGQRAFFRLQEEIIKYNDDTSIFAWSLGDMVSSGLLAPAPSSFVKSRLIKAPSFLRGPPRPFSMTNRGLSITIWLLPWSIDTYLGYISCEKESSFGGSVDVTIILRRLRDDDQYVRIKLNGQDLVTGGPGRFSSLTKHIGRERQIFVRQTPAISPDSSLLHQWSCDFEIDPLSHLPPEATTEMVSSFSPCESPAGWNGRNWGCAQITTMSIGHSRIRAIALGCDLDYNPICVLASSLLDDLEFQRWQHDTCDWSAILDSSQKWNRDSLATGQYYLQQGGGSLVLKGNRYSPLEVNLSKHPFNGHFGGYYLQLFRGTPQDLAAWQVFVTRDRIDCG